MTTWTFGGTALSTYGTVRFFDDSYDMPDNRGDNVVIPFSHGRRFAKSYYDQRVLTFVITYQGASLAALETNLDNLRAKLAQRTLQTLAETRQDATVRNISAVAKKPLQMDLSSGNNIAKYVIEFECPYPFSRLSTAIADNTTTINANPKAMTVTNPGTVEEEHPTIIFTGPLSNTVITNSTNGCVLTYTGTIASPRVVTLSYNTTTGEWNATTDLGANVIANFSHSGASNYMTFDVGANTLSIADGTHTTGTIKVTFNAPFL